EGLFNGNNTSGAPGLWETDGTAAGTHELTGINGANSNISINPSGLASVTLTVPPPDNFNSDNTSDILFRNASTGDTWFAAISNGAFNSWKQIGGSNTA